MFWKKKNSVQQLSSKDRSELAIKMIKKHIEPTFKNILNKFNITLKQYKISVGAEIKWIFDDLSE